MDDKEQFVHEHITRERFEAILLMLIQTEKNTSYRRNATTRLGILASRDCLYKPLLPFSKRFERILLIAVHHLQKAVWPFFSKSLVLRPRFSNLD